MAPPENNPVQDAGTAAVAHQDGPPLKPNPSQNTLTNTPTMQIVGIVANANSQMGVVLRTTIENKGPKAGEISGGCTSQCMVQAPGHLSSTYFGVQSGSIINASQQRVLAGYSEAAMCAGTAPLQLQCTYTVDAYPKDGSPPRELHISQTLPLPASYHP